MKADGADVAVYSRHGTKVFICVFEGNQERRIVLRQRDGDVHYDFVSGLSVGTRYGFRVDGPWAPELGLHFDLSKLLIDPFAWSLDQPFTYHDTLSQRGLQTAHIVPKCVAEAIPPDVTRKPYQKPSFIYEVPVCAFTKLHPDVPIEKRGTMAALSEPSVIEHFKNIGVDTIELMPITAWIDERHLTALGLHNAWGYNPVQFFAADPKLAPGGLTEIRDTISELHKNGFNVILDIVLNHTGEGDAFGPTLCFRGLDNTSYYAHAGPALINDTGCGNTVYLNEPHVVAMVIAALRHWVLKAGVDGFRFDLATVMGRLPHGFESGSPLLNAIEADDVLSTCIMIAEPWDIGPGGYQLGNFPARWHEWNDKFRDDVRRFWRGDHYSANALATRVTGSSDVFKNPSRSINFIAAHDGFTLRDLINYSHKQNLNNGEQNRDGKSDEVTWLGGDERALLATLFLSRGIPMLTAGDEFGRSQNGNNNAYAQANEITWLDWGRRDHGLINFVKLLSNFRNAFFFVQDDTRLVESDTDDVDAVVAQWFNSVGQQMDWSVATNRFIGLLLKTQHARWAFVFVGDVREGPMPIAAAPGKVWQCVMTSRQEHSLKPFAVEVFRETSTHS